MQLDSRIKLAGSIVSPYGRRYIVDFVVVKEGRPASVRTAWIIKRDEVMPRLTSCFVL